MWDVLEIIAKVTGLPADKQTLRKKAKAIATVIRKFNLREGMTAGNGCLTPALCRPQADSGKVITENELNTMLKAYY